MSKSPCVPSSSSKIQGKASGAEDCGEQEGVLASTGTVIASSGHNGRRDDNLMLQASGSFCLRVAGQLYSSELAQAKEGVWSEGLRFEMRFPLGWCVQGVTVLATMHMLDCNHGPHPHIHPKNRQGRPHSGKVFLQQRGDCCAFTGPARQRTFQEDLEVIKPWRLRRPFFCSIRSGFPGKY